MDHKVPLYVSPTPDQEAWEIDALNISWSGIIAYVYPPTALLHRVSQSSPQPSGSQHPNLHAWCLRCGQLSEQAFSVEVAEKISAPQKSSTRTVYKSKCALFEKWCRENLVDFSTLTVKQISDFFMYLDLNIQLSTIDGYRTAIVDNFGSAGLHISQSSDLNRLISSFHRDPPKRSRNLPK